MAAKSRRTKREPQGHVTLTVDQAKFYELALDSETRARVRFYMHGPSKEPATGPITSARVGPPPRSPPCCRRFSRGPTWVPPRSCCCRRSPCLGNRTSWGKPVGVSRC